MTAADAGVALRPRLNVAIGVVTVVNQKTGAEARAIVERVECRCCLSEAFRFVLRRSESEALVGEFSDGVPRVTLRSARGTSFVDFIVRLEGAFWQVTFAESYDKFVSFRDVTEEAGQS